MSAYAPLLAALVALLAGLTIGKAWERYKLRDGKWIDRRRARESPHYILGLNFLVADQIDLAIEELSRAASLDADALEVHMILGNLYREKGQVGKAITVHQNLLQRPRLSRLEHAYVLLCLGLDYKRGGFVDRALEAFNEVLRLDQQNEYALLNLQKLHEEQHQWTEAYDTRQRLSKLTTTEARPQSQAILAFLENEIGLEALRRKDYAEAIRRFATNAPPPKSGSASSTSRPTARTSRSIGSRRSRSARASRIDSLGCAGGSSTTTRRTGAPAWRCHATWPPAGIPRRRSTCCLQRSCRTRTRSAFIRPSGARSGSCTIRRRSSIATPS